MSSTTPSATRNSASFDKLQVENGRPWSPGLDLAIFLISRRCGKVDFGGRPPLYFGYSEANPSALKLRITSRTRSSLVNATFAIPAASMSCADSSTICARRHVTTDPLPRRTIRTSRRPSSSSSIPRTRRRSVTGPVCKTALDLVLSGTLSSSRAQKAAKQRQVRRVSEPELIKLPLFEPADGVMLFWLQVRHGPPPAPRDPHSQVQTSVRDDPVQNRAAIDALKLSPQLLGHLPPERIFGPLARLDVTTGEVPHIRKPPPAWRTVTQQQLVPPTQDHGYNVVILHRPSIPLTGQRLSDAALDNPVRNFHENTALHQATGYRVVGTQKRRHGDRRMRHCPT